MTASDSPIAKLTDFTFDEQLTGADRPVLVDFWAEWCGPCKRIAPMLEDLAQSHGNQLLVAKLNVDENPATAQRFDVMSIPTLILFREGQPANRIVGAVSKTKLLQEIGATIL